MPTDIQFTSEKAIRLTERGDYASVDGQNNVRQQIVLDILTSVGSIEKATLTPNKRAEYLSDVRDALRVNDAVDELRSVSLTVGENDETIELTVRTESDKYGVYVQQ